MIQELFLSLLSGLSILLGLNPDSPWFLAGKAGVELTAGARIACWLGLINGLVLLFIKFKQDLKSKELLAASFAGALFYQIFCNSYFTGWVVDLRVFTWIFAGTIVAAYFFRDIKIEKTGLKIFSVLILSYTAQIPGSAGWLLLLILLYSSRLPIKSSVLVLCAGLAGFAVARLFTDGSEFIRSSTGIRWGAFTASYLISCVALFASAQLLVLLFRKGMEKISAHLGVASALLLLFLTSRLGGNLSGEQPVRYTFPSMGTTCEITIWSPNESESKKHAEKAREVIDSIEAVLSTYKPDSEINKLNATAFKEPFKCSDIMWQNFLWAEKAYELSNKAFDVTIGPLVKLWAIKKKRSDIPSKDEINEVLKRIGFDKLVLDHQNRTVKFKVEGLSVDFGGLTKGWAVDQAVLSLAKSKETKFIVNLGGNLYCSPSLPENKDTFKIGIKDPRFPEKLCTAVNARGVAVATSGNYEQFIMIEGKRYTHIIDPRSGFPVDGVDSVTVISPSATVCDVLSTSIFVNGADSINELQEKIKDLSVLFIDIKENSEPEVIKIGVFEPLDVKLHLLK